MIPGCTRAQRSSSLTSSTWFMYLLKSITMAWLTVCPAKLVPPERGRTGTWLSRATSITARTSSTLRGMTTPTGCIW